MARLVSGFRCSVGGKAQLISTRATCATSTRPLLFLWINQCMNPFGRSRPDSTHPALAGHVFLGKTQGRMIMDGCRGCPGLVHCYWGRALVMLMTCATHVLSQTGEENAFTRGLIGL